MSPAIFLFEVAATVRRMNRRGMTTLHDFRIMGDSEEIYPIDQEFIHKASPLFHQPGFKDLFGDDLVFACVAKIVDAWLVTLVSAFRKEIGKHPTVIDLNDSRQRAAYRKLFPMAG